MCSKSKIYKKNTAEHHCTFNNKLGKNSHCRYVTKSQNRTHWPKCSQSFKKKTSFLWHCGSYSTIAKSLKNVIKISKTITFERQKKNNTTTIQRISSVTVQVCPLPTVYHSHRQTNRVKLELLPGFGSGHVRCLAWAEIVCVFVCVFMCLCQKQRESLKDGCDSIWLHSC